MKTFIFSLFLFLSSFTVVSAADTEIYFYTATQGATQYNIWRKVNAGVYGPYTNVSAPTTELLMTTLIPGNTYCYKVRAQINGVWTPFYNEWCFDDTLPPPVSNLSGTFTKGCNGCMDTMELIWDEAEPLDAANPNDSYRIWRNIDGGSYGFFTSLVLPATTFTDHSLSPAHAYCYKLKTRRSGIDGPLSSEICACE